MNKFADVIKQDTPRLVVMFARPTPDSEAYQWGILGQLPLMSLIGYITRVQAELAFKSPPTCPESALAIAWVDLANQDGTRTVPPNPGFCYFVHPDIPVDSLVGMLDVIKGALVSSQLAQQVRNQQVGLLGPDGQPMRR